MDSRNASEARVVSVTLTVLVVSATIGTVIGVTEVAAQKDGEKNIIARTPLGENITVQRGETVALGYPKGDVTRGYSWAYTWEVKNGDTSNLLLHTGSADAAGEVPAHNGRVTSFRATKEGEYTISLTVRALDRSIIDTISRQITVSESSGPVSYDKMKEYAPVIRFEEDELYRPTRIEAIFENAELRKGVPSSEQEFEVFNNANLYDVAVRERPEGQPSTDDAFEFLLPIEIEETDTLVGGLWQGVFGVTPADAGTDGLVDPNLLTHLDDPDIYPRTVYAQTVDEVEFDPREFDPREELPESGEYYEELDSIVEVDLTEDTYTAVGYWMMYVNDPKPEHVRGFDPDSWTSFGRAAGHTGDASVVYILFNDDGNPEWVLNQQHKGGEYRRWEHVEKENGRPVIYVAQGAHTSFFGTGQTDKKVDKVVRSPADGEGTDLTGEKEKPEYIYQGQYFNTPGRTDIFEVGVDVPSVGVIGKDIEGYVDIITYDGNGHEWMPKDDYEVSVLTGDGAWSDYTGDYLTYPHSLRVGENPGATASKIPQNNPQFENPGSWAEYRLFPDVAQIDGEFSDEEKTFTELRGPFSFDGPKERIQQSVIRPEEDEFLDGLPDCVKVTKKCIEAPPAIVKKNDRVTPNKADGSVGVNVINSGMQPHEFVLDLSTDSGNQADYSFYVNSIYPKNVAGAEVPLNPLEISEPREYTVDATLSIYTDAYELDDEEFELNITDELPDPSLEITEDEEIDSGTVEETRSTTVDVSITGLRRLPEDGDWTVSVGGEEVEAEPDFLGAIDSLGGSVPVRFTPPDKDEPGTYDVTVILETEDETLSDTKEDLLVYSEPGEVTQTATALVIDTSGSMGARDVGGGSRMDAAKDAALGVVDRQSDSDYVSVVGFSWGSNVRQGLTQLDEGRGSAESAIASMNDGGATNMGSGLSDGIDEVMEAPDGVQKNVILMSDGGRNRGPSEAAMRDMIRNRMNPNGICLQTSTLGSGADFGLMRSLNNVADCSENTESFTRDEIVQDFINLSREFDASESVLEEIGEIDDGGTFDGIFGIDEDTTNAIVDIATDTDTEPTSGLSVRSNRTDHKIDVDDNRTGTGAGERVNASDTVDLFTRTNTRTPPENRDVRLYRPNGSLVDPENSSDIEVSSTEDRTVYRLNDPEAGNWSYEIDGGEEGTEFEVVITSDSLTKLDVEASSDEYYTGSSATLTAKVFGEEAVTDADIEAVVEAPDGSSKTVVLEEVSAGVYQANVELEEGVSGTYEARVKAVQEEENVERRATVSWDAEFAAPVSVDQANIPVTEPGSEGKTELKVEAEALLGIRSVELGLSDFTHEASNATIPSSRVSMNRSHLIEAGETIPIETTVSVPADMPMGVYTAEAGALVDDSGVTVDEVELRVDNTKSDCVDRRYAGRGETDEMCSRERDMSRGEERGYERRDRGRGDRRGDGAGRHDRGR